MKFNLNDRVSLTLSGESGDVIGRAEYINAPASYLVRYKAADGRQVETWLAEDALSGVAIVREKRETKE